MEGGESSSSFWDEDVFSINVHQEDDDEALKWAAIQKLPTTPNEIDIHKLGFQQRRSLLERLAQEDNETFLLKLRNRIDRVGIDIPAIEVRFEHLNVEAEAHVGSRALPSITNYMFDILEVV